MTSYKPRRKKPLYSKPKPTNAMSRQMTPLVCRDHDQTPVRTPLSSNAPCTDFVAIESTLLHRTQKGRHYTQKTLHSLESPHPALLDLLYRTQRDHHSLESPTPALSDLLQRSQKTGYILQSPTPALVDILQHSRESPHYGHVSSLRLMSWLFCV